MFFLREKILVTVIIIICLHFQFFAYKLLDFRLRNEKENPRYIF